MTVTHVSLAGVPMELHLGSPAGEPLATRLDELADLIGAGLFEGVAPIKNDTIAGFLQRCASTLAERYETVPMNIEFSREERSPTPFVATIQFEYVDVVEAHDFFRALLRADRTLAITLIDELAAAGAWWFPVFGPRAAYEMIDCYRFACPSDWWDDMSYQTKDAMELDREPTNREIRRYIRAMKVPTRGMYARRIGSAFCRARAHIPFKQCAERIAKLRSKNLRARAEALRDAVAQMHSLRRKMDRLHTRDDKDLAMEDDQYEHLPAFILETSPALHTTGYVTEVFGEYDQDVMNGNGWGPSFHFALEPNPQSVGRLQKILDAYASAYGLLHNLKLSIGDSEE